MDGENIDATGATDPRRRRTPTSAARDRLARLTRTWGQPGTALSSSTQARVADGVRAGDAGNGYTPVRVGHVREKSSNRDPAHARGAGGREDEVRRSPRRRLPRGVTPWTASAGWGSSLREFRNSASTSWRAGGSSSTWRTTPRPHTLLPRLGSSRSRSSTRRSPLRRGPGVRWAQPARRFRQCPWDGVWRGRRGRGRALLSRGCPAAMQTCPTPTSASSVRAREQRVPRTRLGTGPRSIANSSRRAGRRAAP